MRHPKTTIKVIVNHALDPRITLKPQDGFPNNFGRTSNRNNMEQVWAGEDSATGAVEVAAALSGWSTTEEEGKASADTGATALVLLSSFYSIYFILYWEYVSLNHPIILYCVRTLSLQ